MSVEGLPMAPKEPNLVQKWKASQLGKKDAKKYALFGDQTITHALLRIQARAQQGQYRVNRWLLDSINPLIGANDKIAAQVDFIGTQISTLKSHPGLSGREQKANLEKRSELEARLSAGLSQMKFNLDEIEIYRKLADESRTSWVAHFNSLASIYIRSINRSVDGKAKAAPAEVPQFTSIPLVDIAELTDFGLGAKDSN